MLGLIVLPLIAKLRLLSYSSGCQIGKHLYKLCNTMQHNTIKFNRFPEKIFILDLQKIFAVKSYKWFNLSHENYLH